MVNDLTEKHCEACEGGVAAMTLAAAKKELTKLDQWSINETGTEIFKDYKFKDFYRTLAFVNAVAYIANKENHHPDLNVGYNYCHIRYNTHAIRGLSINDFICAAKIDALSKF